MKYYYIIIALRLSLKTVIAQNNLVPNPSFEIYINCPTIMTQIYFAFPWFTGSKDMINGALISSTDYYNSCNNSINGFVGVPVFGSLGFQYPRTGNAFAGYIFWETGGGYREYLEVKLIEPLDSGIKYCVGFWVNNSGFGHWAIDAFGLVFTKDSLLTIEATPIIRAPDIENPSGNIITDSLNWTKISGEYIAKGGEKFITIGCFLNNSDINKIVFSHYNDYAYYLVDDVSVVRCDEINPIPIIVVYPSPALEDFTIEAKGNTVPIYFEIYNAIGQFVYKSNMIEKTVVPTANFAAGMYVIRFRNSERLEYRKVVKCN